MAARSLLVVLVLCPALTAAAKLAEVDVVVDFTPEGRKVEHPTPSNPAYYYPVLGGFQELGSVVAGEKPPKQWEVAHMVAVALAKQGYLEMKPTPYLNSEGQVTYKDGTVVTVPAKPVRGAPLALNAPGGIPLTAAMLDSPEGPYSLKGARSAPDGGAGAPSPAMEVLQAADPVHGPVMKGTPDLVLAIQWGCANPENVNTNMSMSPLNDLLYSDPVNASKMLGLVAGHTLDNNDVSFRAEPLIERAMVDRYFAMVSAYDYNAYKKTGKSVLLWQAKMSTPSDGVVEFANVLAALVTAGGPHFGRESNWPEAVLFPVTPEGKVIIGEPRVVSP